MLNKKALSAALGVTAPDTDSNFKQTVLLLHGDGTNGAQNNTFTDGSTNNFTITRNGNTTQGTFSPFSQTGWSNYFDGSGDYLTVPDNAAFAFGSGDFTIECWLYNSGTDGFICAQTNNSDANGSAFVLYITSGALNALVYYGGGSFISITDSASFPLNQWVHVALVRSSSTVTLYVNGSSKGTGNISTNSVNDVSSVVAIGARSSGSDPLTGYISNLRIVKGTAVYTAGFTPPTTALTAITNTSLLTCQSNRFLDTSTNAFTITANGNTSIQAFSPFAPSAAYSAGTNGGSAYFDGTGDYLTLPSSSNLALGSGDFCVELWLYASSVSAAAGLVGNSTSAGDGDAQYEVQFSSSAFPRFVGWTSIFLTSNTAITANQWCHIAVCRSGTNCSMFLNGSRVANATVSQNFSSTNAVNIGRQGTGSAPLNGYLSSVRIVKGSSVYDPAQTTLTVPTAPLTSITNTSFLCNFTNAGIIDNTGKNVLETVGNAQIDTGTKKYGTGSLEFDGTGDYLIMRSTPNFEFGTGDFTIEFWVRFTSTSQFIHMYDQRPASTDGAYPTIRLNTNGNGLEYIVSGSSRISGGSITTGTWYHIAVARSGTSTKMFLDGTQVGSTYTDSTNYINGTDRPYIGGSGYHVTQYYLDGYIDDLRVTKGVARYTANFTAPTKAFADQ